MHASPSLDARQPWRSRMYVSDALVMSTQVISVSAWADLARSCFPYGLPSRSSSMLVSLESRLGWWSASITQDLPRRTELP